MTTLIVLSDPVPLDAAEAAVPRGEAADLDVLAFGRASETGAAIVETFRSRVRRILPARDLMREAVPAAREKFVRFTAEWPDRPVVFGRDFRRAFDRAGCSAWWFSELSQRNTGTRPTFARLCELEALRLALSRVAYDRVVVIGRDRDQARVLVQACDRAHVAAVVAPKPTVVDGPGVIRLLLGRIKQGWLDVVATFLARRHRLPATVSIGPASRSLAFHTWFPSQWRSWRGVVRDRYYVDVPDAIHRLTPWRTFYACSVPTTSLAVLRDNVEAAARQVRAEPDQYLFLERWASLRDVVRIYADLRPALKLTWLEWFDRRFRRSFDWEGIDIFPLVRHDLRISILRDLPYYELLAHRIRRMTATLQPSDFITVLETYAYGRAVAWGVRSAAVGTRVVGYQHSPVNSNQLMYRFTRADVAQGLPLPDVFLLHGEHARGMLRSSGVPEDHLVVTGAPRFDDLVEFRRQRREQFAELRRPWAPNARTRIVLVATVIWPDITRALINICARALGDRPDTVVLVKPHPLHRAIDGDLRAAFGGRQQVAIADDDLNRLQASADVMVGAFGTSDAEAIAIGCPVVRVALTDFDLSPTSDEPGATIEVTSADELRQAIDGLLAGEQRPDRVAELLERVFYKLDGRSADRVVAALDRLDRTPAAVPA